MNTASNPFLGWTKDLLEWSKEMQKSPEYGRMKKNASCIGGSSTLSTWAIKVLKYGLKYGPAIDCEIEIVKGSRIKYEKTLDGELKLDRVVSIPYPIDYGFVCETEDGIKKLKERGINEFDDAVVLSPQDIVLQSGVPIKCVPIGKISMIDSGELDDKLIVIPVDQIEIASQFQSVMRMEQSLNAYIWFLYSYKIKSNDDWTNPITVTGLRFANDDTTLSTSLEMAFNQVTAEQPCSFNKEYFPENSDV